MENIYRLKDLRPNALPVHNYDEFRGSKTPIIIDNGSWECRAGWATDKDPRLVFRNVLAKTRRDKSKESAIDILSNKKRKMQGLQISFFLNRYWTLTGFHETLK